MMDELVQDLVSALEQASEQTKLGELWEEMVLSPLQHRRQIRRRRGRKRLHESSIYPVACRRRWNEAPESSMDEAKEYRENLSSSFSTAVANYSDSDDMATADHWPHVARAPVRSTVPGRSRHPSWPESDSFTDSNPGQPLRRRRKVKRMTSNMTIRLQQKLHDGRKRHRPSKLQRLSGSRRRSSSWTAAERQAEGGRVMGKECWKRQMAKERRDAPDENMSDGETSSTCSSDPGLFTNDEGRQGDDEQSDWFFEGDCGVGLLPNWDSDNPLSLEDRQPSNFLLPAQRSVRGSRQINFVPGMLCSADVRRKKEAEAVFITTSANNPFHNDHQNEGAKEGSFSNPPNEETVGPTTPGSPTSTMPASSCLLQRNHEDT
ncbi:PREDICTED: G patch domain-containing protein 2-like [Cyprinodon variegatus]|uniref:G patch domain-containing protein 2-like n=1 Tax=Cyprinodon variegatus TaxID=28743 RepID=UPI00074279AD|nr:PREDICTED: G patch domain-containing protein 2-like [Cyprinodon variegatus]